MADEKVAGDGATWRVLMAGTGKEETEAKVGTGKGSADAAEDDDEVDECAGVVGVDVVGKDDEAEDEVEAGV